MLTAAAEDALERLMEPLALRLATAPTFGTAVATAPKVLSDIMESLLGGVFLDCGAWRRLHTTPSMHGDVSCAA